MTDHELDKLVCEAVGIPYATLGSSGLGWPEVICPPISTALTFEQFEKIVAWLRTRLWSREPLVTFGLQPLDDDEWAVVQISYEKHRWFPVGNTIARAVCLAEAEIVKEKTRNDNRS